nr:unnamed protein product [Callosobruchus analis]
MPKSKITTKAEKGRRLKRQS